MKTLFKFLIPLMLLLGAIPSFAQQGDQRFSATLNATCGNLNTTCGAVAGSQLNVGVSAQGMASFTVSGTYSGATVNFEFSDDGGTTWFQNTCTRSDAPIQEVNEVLPSNAIREWDCGIAAITNVRIRLSALSTGSVNAAITVTYAQIDPAPTVAIIQPQSVISGQQAVTASAVALASNIIKNVCVKASVLNTINIFVGTSGVSTATGIELAPGDSTCFALPNTNVLFVIASTTGANVSWIATN